MDRRTFLKNILATSGVLAVCPLVLATAVSNRVELDITGQKLILYSHNNKQVRNVSPYEIDIHLS